MRWNTTEIWQSIFKRKKAQTKMTLCFWKCDSLARLWIWTALNNGCQINLSSFWTVSLCIFCHQPISWLVSLHSKMPSLVLMLATWLALLPSACSYQYRKTHCTDTQFVRIPSLIHMQVQTHCSYAGSLLCSGSLVTLFLRESAHQHKSVQIWRTDWAVQDATSNQWSDRIKHC